MTSSLTIVWVRFYKSRSPLGEYFFFSLKNGDIPHFGALSRGFIEDAYFQWKTWSQAHPS